jgi:inhibitor of growth protein 4
MDEQLYCVCHEISYGQMIACENNECKKEWFHLECVKLKEIPTGMWYCNDCLPQNTTTNLKKIIE